MPVHNGSGSNQDERLLPAGPAGSQGNPVCAKQRIDGEVVACAEPAIADEGPDFQGRGPPALKAADLPPEEMPERHEHGKKLIGKA